MITIEREKAMIRRRAAAVGTGSAALLVTLWLAVPGSPAYAATCTTSSHCYGIVVWNSSSQLFGINQGLNVSCLGPMNASTSSNFVTEEQWLLTANSSGAYWVEVGMAYGAPQGSTRYFFWADSRPNGGGYHEHDLSISADLKHTYDDYITWVGNNSWQIRRDGSTLGTSTANPGPAHYAEAGEELTANTGAAAGTSEYLYKQTSSGGAWTSNWGGSIRVADPPFGGWITTNWSADFYSNCSFLTAPAPDPGPTFTAFSSSTALQAVKDIATQLSVANGDTAPRSRKYVLTTRQAAASATSQAIVDTDQPVYLVSFEGNFSRNIAKVPSGAVRPHGSVMTAVIDPTTGRIVDWGIEERAPNLASLGLVQQLD